jgi:UMF1 family MFS transporter
MAFLCYNMKVNLANKKGVQRAWTMYDWANSVYSLVITSTIFPIYYNSVTKNVDGSDLVDFFGWEVVNTVLYSYSISFSFLVIAILSPLLSGIADASGMKLSFLKFFTYLGSISCVGLFFFEGDNLEFGIICSVMASVGYAGGIVFYNAYLPEIAEESEYDFLSARGFALGYIGGVVLLIVNLLMIQFPDAFGIPGGGFPARLSFLITGVWWAGFAQVPFRVLPKNPFQKTIRGKFLLKGYHEIRKVFFQLRELPVMKRFLVSFFFYSMGVQTVMYLAASFGDKELGLPGDQLILTVLIIQFVAVGGSYLFAYFSRIWGNKASLMILVCIWVGICCAAYYVYSVYEFYALAFVVGMVMGGIQSLSRSTFSKLIPQTSIDHASFFSFYDVTEKLAIVVGTFSYGAIEQYTGSMRNSAVSLGVFFIIGLGFLLIVTLPKRTLSVSNL